MKFEDYFEANKEVISQLTIHEIMRRTWQAAWAEAVQRYWMEAYKLGIKEGRKQEKSPGGGTADLGV